MTPPIRVLVCDDQPVTRFGLVSLLSGHPDFAVVGEVEDGESATSRCLESRPDVVVIDFRLPPHDAAAVLRELRSRGCRASVLVWTSGGTAEQARVALALGARGFLRKTASRDAFLEAVRTVARGGRVLERDLALELATMTANPPLSPRELEVLVEVASGATNKQIGSRLGVAEATVRTHVGHLLDKLDATDRTAAVAIAIRRGLIAA